MVCKAHAHYTRTLSTFSSIDSVSDIPLLFSLKLIPFMGADNHHESVSKLLYVCHYKVQNYSHFQDALVNFLNPELHNVLLYYYI